jgi:spermidine synthase
LYAINTIRGVFGSFVLGFYALPYLGLSRALFALSLGYVLLAAFVSLVRRNTVAWRALVFASMATGVLMLAGDTIPELDQQRHKSTQTTLHHQDTSSATYTVYESKRGSRSLLVNNQKGLRDSSYRIAAVQAQLGHLSVLLANQPKRALLFGFGTGVELAAMAHHPLSQVDCVALQGQTVVSLSSFFSQANLQMKWKRPAYKKTGIRIFEGDGRRTLLRKGPAYDLVVSSLPLPEQAGVGALLSHEQFQAVKRRLSDRGMFVLWLPLHRWGTRELAVVTRTFLASFPDAKAWLGTWSKTLPVLGLIGWKKQFHPISAPYARSVKESLRRWRHHYSREYFGRQAATTDLLTMSGSLSLHARMWISTDVLQMVSHSAALNRLERPVIELMAPRSLFRVRSHPHSLLREHIRLFRRHGALLSTPWSVSLR